MDLGSDVEMHSFGTNDPAVTTFQSQYHKRPSFKQRPSLDPLYTSMFYSSFWPSHPFLPPNRDIEDHLRGSEETGLIHAINYIASLYVCAGNDQLRPLDFPQKLHQYPQNGFSVQSLILLAISSHMYNDHIQAQALLHTASDIAIGIELHRHEFSTSHGKGSHVMAETWRRTWWELYILDYMFAGLNQTSNMRLKGVVSDVLLPCEEEEYHSDEEVCTSNSRPASTC